MAGQLVQVATETVTSAVASVTLTGIDSDDVYMVTVNNAQPVDDNKLFIARVTVSGTPQSTANYDYAYKDFDSTTTFINKSGANNTYWLNHRAIGNSTSEMANAIYYLYNFNSSSEYSFITVEATDTAYTNNNIGSQGGGVYTVAEAHNGLSMVFSTGNIASGTFTLYKVV